jgi:hypothetical protein
LPDRVGFGDPDYLYIGPDEPIVAF